MAGVKGRSGGARPNTGGKRPGAGRKPKQPEVVAEVELEPLQFLKKVMLGHIDASPTQLKAAIAAAQYVHTKKSDGGKRDEQAENAKKASTGKFSAAAPPRLVVNNRK